MNKYTVWIYIEDSHSVEMSHVTESSPENAVKHVTNCYERNGMNWRLVDCVEGHVISLLQFNSPLLEMRLL